MFATIPVAPETEPITLSPSTKLATEVVPVSLVNILISNMYRFHIDVFEYTSPLSVPEYKSMFLTLATPIWSDSFTPGVDIAVPKSSHSLNGDIVSSPASLPNSGNECAFLTLSLLPILIGVFALSNDVVVLAFEKGRVVVPILSISYPLM